MVIIDAKSGRTITTKGRKDIQEQGFEVFEEWVKKSEQLAKAAEKEAAHAAAAAK